MHADISLSRVAKFLAGLLAVCSAASAHAHTDGIATGGFIAGFSHP